MPACQQHQDQASKHHEKAMNGVLQQGRGGSGSVLGAMILESSHLTEEDCSIFVCSKDMGLQNS